jgi:hypothetical protein
VLVQAYPGSERGPREERSDRHEPDDGAQRGRGVFAHRGKPGGTTAQARAVTEAPTVVAGFDDFAVMCQPIGQRRRHLGVAGPWPHLAMISVKVTANSSAE